MQEFQVVHHFFYGVSQLRNLMKNMNTWMSKDNHKSEMRLSANVFGCQGARTITYFKQLLVLVLV